MNQESKPCAICYPRDKQTKILLKNLYRRYTKTQIRTINSFKDHLVQSPFAKTLNNVFKTKQIKYNDVSKCREHTLIKKKFLDGLRISEDELNKKSQYILMLEIRRSYTLDLLGNQVKETPARITQIVSGEQSEKYKAELQKEKEKKIKKKKELRQNKALQQMKSEAKEEFQMKPIQIIRQKQSKTLKKSSKIPWYKRSIEQMIRIEQLGQNMEEEDI